MFSRLFHAAMDVATVRDHNVSLRSRAILNVLNWPEIMTGMPNCPIQVNGPIIDIIG